MVMLAGKEQKKERTVPTHAVITKELGAVRAVVPLTLGPRGGQSTVLPSRVSGITARTAPSSLVMTATVLLLSCHTVSWRRAAVSTIGPTPWDFSVSSSCRNASSIPEDTSEQDPQFVTSFLGCTALRETVEMVHGIGAPVYLWESHMWYPGQYESQGRRQRDKRGCRHGSFACRFKKDK
ncbi:unnamed protein product [Cyprideis torosa]|uniref:Uncharacterized protein n=1 Tax=Cyprideis torosa TaxID=163714 RepID=A0A7R8WFA7_9CRUS|nr:unnamed protein product [Cyprideis torosa]CAG0896787.1 unnamed protein product [Cyprideis torosa]